MAGLFVGQLLCNESVGRLTPCAIAHQVLNLMPPLAHLSHGRDVGSLRHWKLMESTQEVPTPLAMIYYTWNGRASNSSSLTIIPWMTREENMECSGMMMLLLEFINTGDFHPSWELLRTVGGISIALLHLRPPNSQEVSLISVWSLRVQVLLPRPFLQMGMLWKADGQSEPNLFSGMVFLIKYEIIHNSEVIWELHWNDQLGISWTRSICLHGGMLLCT